MPTLRSAERTEVFIGIETVNSPARGLLTLFMVGRLGRLEIVDAIDDAQEDADVLKLKLNLSHLHFGARSSFDGDQTQVWSDNIKHFLREGFWCTLTLRAEHVILLSKTGLCRHSRFIPIIDVPVPNALALGHNATLKFSEAMYSTTNPGNWSTSLAGLLHNKDLLTKHEEVPPIINLKPRTKSSGHHHHSQQKGRRRQRSEFYFYFSALEYDLIFSLCQRHFSRKCRQYAK